jgi:hypothetical protein
VSGARETPPAAGSRRLRAAGSLLALTLACVLLPAAAAHALAGRGHAFTTSFGEGTLSEPGAIALSEATGDTYVLDRANDRVVVFAPSGQFLAAWGYGVTSGKASWQVCSSGCQAGSPHKGFLLAEAQYITVDNCSHEGHPCTTKEDPSVGDVYIAAPHEHEEQRYESLLKLSPAGRQLEHAGKITYSEEGERETLEEIEPAEVDGLSAAPDGTVWLSTEEDLYPLSDQKLSSTAGAAPLEVTLEGQPAPGLATDGTLFYLGVQTAPHGPDTITAWRLAEGELSEQPSPQDGQDTTALALDPQHGALYLDNQDAIVQSTLAGSVEQELQAQGLSDSAGVAVDAATNTIYATDAHTGQVDVFATEAPGPPTITGPAADSVSPETATLSASIDPRGAATPTTTTVQYGTAPCTQGACTATPGPALGGPGFGQEGFGEQQITVPITGLTPASTYHYRFTATGEDGQATSTEGIFATPAASGLLVADARGWELVSPAQKEGAAVEAPREEGGLMQAAGDGGAVTYVTDAPIGDPEGSRSLEATQMLACSAREHGCAPGAAQTWSSKDIVTPNERGSGGTPAFPTEYQLFSSDLALALVQPIAENNSSGPLAEPPLTPPSSEAERGHQEKSIYLRSDTPIAPETPAQAAIYEQAQSNGQAMGNAGFLALLNGADVTSGEPFGPTPGAGHESEVEAATPDLSHVLLSSPAPLTPGAANNDLYEWTEDRLTLVNLPPGGGAPIANARAGSEHGFSRGAISNDGTRVFWSAEEGHLYVRKTSAPEQTLQLDVAQGVSEPPVAGAVFQSASGDGDRVFFTDTEPLTPGAGAGERSPDLYVCELSENPASHLLEPCRLTDLTPPLQGEAADVQGVVIGAAQDGSSVFFVADGALTATPNDHGETAQAGGCLREPEHATAPAATCNLYTVRYQPATGWGAPVFIARLSGEQPSGEHEFTFAGDQPDWESSSDNPPDLGDITSRVSPNGRFLAFMSERPLTGYDNRATSPAAHDAPVEEVYLYDAHSGRLVCVSCDPSGARPLGLHDPSVSEDTSYPEGYGLLVDRRHVWADRWLAASVPGYSAFKRQYALYQPRYLSNAGRVFFDTPEALVAQDHNGLQDVYEYEPQGVPQGPHQCTAQTATFAAAGEGCVGLISSGSSTHESAFVDASETGGEGEHGETLAEGGGDAFFVTAAPLVPADTDNALDLYDAHECLPSSPCLIPPQESPPEDCASSATCEPYTPLSPPLGAPTSARPGAAGNLSAASGVLATNTGHGAAGKPEPKPSRAQLLAKALTACRREHPHSHARRGACERAAHKRYAPPRRASAHRTSRRAR